MNIFGSELWNISNVFENCYRLYGRLKNIKDYFLIEYFKVIGVNVGEWMLVRIKKKMWLYGLRKL